MADEPLESRLPCLLGCHGKLAVVTSTVAFDLTAECIKRVKNVILHVFS